MLPGAERKRQFYLGIDFIRGDTRVPKLQIWQDKLRDAYPLLSGLALHSAGEVNLLPANSTAVRIHSVGGWGAITMGKNLALTAFELLGLTSRPTRSTAARRRAAHDFLCRARARAGPAQLRTPPRRRGASPDPNVFRHSDPLEGLADGGVFILQSDLLPEAFWQTLPAKARHTIAERKIRLYVLDAFAIAREEASDIELRYRMQGAAFMGAFFAPLRCSRARRSLPRRGCSRESAPSSPRSSAARESRSSKTTFG